MPNVKRTTPAPGTDGLAHTGARWDSGYTVRATSAGKDEAGNVIPTTVRPPYKGPPKRVISGSGSAKMSGGNLVVTPTDVPKGQPFNLVVEF